MMTGQSIMEKIFTGQEIISKRTVGGYMHDVVKCTKCKDLVALNYAWFDPYCNDGEYVHHKCLSKERLEEIQKEKVLDIIH